MSGNRKLAAERQRRHRLRRKCGLVPVTIELEQAALEALITDGVVTPEDLSDKHRMAETLGNFFAEFLVSRCDVG